jgi:2-dehydro-3-deoxyphosphogluconate aldolase / (4S)-4-hydroxy-2-oxoglutarate aldolase
MCGLRETAISFRRWKSPSKPNGASYLEALFNFGGVAIPIESRYACCATVTEVPEGVAPMRREEVRARIEEIGIIPAVRLSSAEDALFAAEAVSRGGIPIVEIEMTVPGAIEVIAHLVKHAPKMIVGAGDVFDSEVARQCLDAGAKFLTSPGLDMKIVEFALGASVVVLPGALTPTEVTSAWKAGADFVKVFPCSQVGGDSYIRALKAPFPHLPLVASGGVNQQTAANFILAGAAALGIGGELIPKDAIRLRQAERIFTLAHRFVKFVNAARAQIAWHRPPIADPVKRA